MNMVTTLNFHIDMEEVPSSVIFPIVQFNRLERLLEILREVKDKSFSLHDWVVKRDCGTVACAVGHLTFDTYSGPIISGIKAAHMTYKGFVRMRLQVRELKAQRDTERRKKGE